MNLQSIDAGTTCCGWASWVNNTLVECGLSRTQGKTMEDRVRDFQFSWKDLDLVVVEKPEIYQQRFWKGDPRDLIDLAMVVGGIIWSAPCSVKTVYPKEWKGQVPKYVTDARALGKLTSVEKKVLSNPTALGQPASVPTSLFISCQLVPSGVT